MDKFQRSYQLDITVPSGEIIHIKPPFTVEFDVTRNDLAGSNYGQVRVYNLSEGVRNKIRQDPQDQVSFRTVALSAGYGSKLSTILLGKISQAGSVRQGTNMVTTMQVFDGGFAAVNAYVSQQYPTGTSQKDVIESLIKSLEPYGVTRGAVGGFPGTLSRGNSFTGPGVSLLSEITGNRFFVDNGKAYCLSEDECIEGDLTVINSASGLLETPLLEQNKLTLEMLFEPRIVVGQRIKLESVTGAAFNTYYKIIGFSHRGMISDSVSGDARTTLSMFCPASINLVAP